MPKKDNPKTKKSSSDDEDPKPPTKSTGAIPKSHSYAGAQETEAKGLKKAAAAAMSEDESDPVAGVWQGRTRSSAKTPSAEGRMSLLERMRAKSKSKSPTKREKSKSKSPPKKEKGKRTKSPSPHRTSFFGLGRKSKSPTKKDPVREEQEEDDDDEDVVKEERRDPISPLDDLKNIASSSVKMKSRAKLTGSDTVPLLETPPDSSPLLSNVDRYKMNLGKLPDPQTCIEAKLGKGSPVEDDLTNSSSVSVTSLVQAVQLDEDSKPPEPEEPSPGKKPKRK